MAGIGRLDGGMGQEPSARPAPRRAMRDHPGMPAAALAGIAGCGLAFGIHANGEAHLSGDNLATAPSVGAPAARMDRTPGRCAAFARQRAGQGAPSGGGGCAAGPAHIAARAAALRAAGPVIA